MKEIEDELIPITGELGDMSEVKLPAVNRKLASQNVRQNDFSFQTSSLGKSRSVLKCRISC